MDSGLDAMKISISKKWFLKKAALDRGLNVECGGVNPDCVPRLIRQSIQPTYDHRKTGDRFTVSSSINGFTLCDNKKLRDPFVRHTIRIHWWDAIKAIFECGHIEVNVTVDGDHAICEDVMELDNDYIGQGNTRRAEWNAGIEKALSQVGDDDE
jgi:hypothetical protein